MNEKPIPLNEQDFEDYVSALIEEAFENINSRVRPAREDAWHRYYGKVDAEPVNGGTDIVVRSVQDAVGTIVPEILDVFTSADMITEFLPSTHDPVEGIVCKNANLAVTSLFWCNEGWMATHDAILEAVISGYGFYKVYRERILTTTTGEQELSGMEAMALSNDPNNSLNPMWNTEASDQEQWDDENFGRYTVTIGKFVDDIKIEAIPASNMIWTYANDFNDVWLVGQVTEVRCSDLVQMGFTVEELENVTFSDYPATEIRGEEDARENNNATRTSKTGRGSKSWAATKVAYYELYIKADKDGDGIAETYKVWAAGHNKNVIKYTPYDGNHPYIMVPAYRIPHSTYSEGLSDRTKEFQEAETRLLRSQIDLADMISGPLIFASTMAGLDENKLANWKANKVIFMRAPDGIKWFYPPDVGGSLLQMAQELKMRREDRTGVSRVGSSLRPEDMADITATTTNEMQESSKKKIQYLARIQAELAIKKLMQKLLVLMIEMEQIVIHVGNDSIQLNTTNFNPKWKLRVKVGLGTGTRIERTVSMTNLYTVLKEIMTTKGEKNPICDWTNINNLLYDYGCMQPGLNILRYIKPVEETMKIMAEQAQQPPQPDPETMKAQAEIQREDQKAQQDMQLDQQKTQSRIALQQQKMIQQMQLQITELQHRLEIERMKAENQMQLDEMELKGEAALEAVNMQMDYELDSRRVELKGESDKIAASSSGNGRLRKPN